MGKQRFNSWWLIAIGIVGGLLGAALLILFTNRPRGDVVAILPPPTPAPIQIHVTGAVMHPDVYDLPIGSRVGDAIEAAGGLLPEAYTESINLAKKLEDGNKVLVPCIPQEQPEISTGSESDTVMNETSFPVNINTASLDELDQLPGIGEVKGQAIIDYREANGPFVAIEQIQNVKGIGPATFEKIKELIIVE